MEMMVNQVNTVNLTALEILHQFAGDAGCRPIGGMIQQRGVVRRCIEPGFAGCIGHFTAYGDDFHYLDTGISVGLYLLSERLDDIRVESAA